LPRWNVAFARPIHGGPGGAIEADLVTEKPTPVPVWYDFLNDVPRYE
jgi:hypothetical protein